jgi:threonyl-tRNA synthetase
MLILHVDYFKSTLTKKGRSKLIEDPIIKTTEVEDALIILTSVEKHDEPNPPDVAKKAIKEVAELGYRLKVKTLVLHPFTHLFGQLSTPEVAITVLELMKEGLGQCGFEVTRTPFGWFNTLELKAKGHPLSRIARRVEVTEGT